MLFVIPRLQRCNVLVPSSDSKREVKINAARCKIYIVENGPFLLIYHRILLVPHALVNPSSRQQLVVRSLLRYETVFEDDDQICICDSLESEDETSSDYGLWKGRRGDEPMGYKDARARLGE